MKRQFFQHINNFIDSKHLGALVTVIEGQSPDHPPGFKFLVDEFSHYENNAFTQPVFLLVKDLVAEIIRVKKPRIVESNIGGLPLKLFIDPIYPQEHLIVLGGGHIALPLVTIAKLLNFDVTLIDDRPEFAATHRFPEADEVICRNFAEVIRETEFDLNTYVVIITRGHQLDQICLGEVLIKPNPAYIGMIGSKRKISTLFQELQNEGFTQEKLDTVYAPIGLDIGAQTPEEIALSIMAEIVMVKQYGFSGGLKTRQGGQS